MNDENDLGGALIFLLSNASVYITGVNLPVVSAEEAIAAIPSGRRWRGWLCRCWVIRKCSRMRWSSVF
jgi:hypothetical protein